MKQSDIKTRRYYRNATSDVIRFVSERDTDDYDVEYVVWRSVESDKNTRENDQDLESFARWADEEVMTVYDAVTRCPKCDEWEWFSHVNDCEITCRKCGTIWDPIHGEVINDGNN